MSCSKSLPLKVLHTSYDFQIGAVCLPLNNTTIFLAEVTLGNESIGMSKDDFSKGMYTPHPSETLLPLPCLLWMSLFLFLCEQKEQISKLMKFELDLSLIHI